MGALARSLSIELADGRVVPRRPRRERRDPRAAVTAAASRVSVHPEVREAMVERQRALIAAGDYVAEGRDIGTVVSPDAPLKVFLTASERGAGPPPGGRDRRGAGSGPRRAAAPRRARPRPRARGAAAGRGRGRDRHHRPRARRGRRAGRRGSPGSGACREQRAARSPSSGFPNVGKSTLVNRLAGGPRRRHARRARA